MTDTKIYEDISKRTGGDIYIGVVGPVRTGKSTFIHRFLENLVIPNIDNDYDKQRTLDEMPQSASGKTIMTTEPKFVPDESVKMRLGDAAEFNVKMIDCVGYPVEGALGGEEEGKVRMVKTPWSNEEIPFGLAAEIGTSKVINEHSTIAMLVTTDGSFTDIPRSAYVEAEERVVRELKEKNKPFAIILNSATPENEEAHSLAKELENKYGVPIALISCPQINGDDIREILSLVLGEFPVKALKFKVPEWMEILDDSHELKRDMIDDINSFGESVSKLSDVDRRLSDFDGIKKLSVNAGEGICEFEMPNRKELYYSIVREITGLDINNEKQLLSSLLELSKIKKKHEKIKEALIDAEEKGYGVVMPTSEELKLEEPQLIKQAGGYGVRITAHAESIHMIKTNIKAELCPVVGTEEQSKEIIRLITSEYEEAPEKIWDFNMFGKSLYDLVSDGMNTKLSHITDESREKLSETLSRIVNEGSNGLICVLL